MKKTKIVFVSNYLNHHQIPFCEAMYGLLDGSFLFIQTEPMEEERVRMGWNGELVKPYLRFFYRELEECEELIGDAEIVIFGGTDEEKYIEKRLEAGTPVLRYSERLYKTGQWKAVSPRGLRKKYHDHTRYRRASVYLLCAGGYVASDFSIVHAYPGKMYCWGYFPETRQYEIEELLENKGWGEGKEPYLLWAARMIGWKHPELAVETAAYLKQRGYRFHMDIIGGGEKEAEVKTLAESYALGDCVRFLGFQPPEKVREYMEKADIFLFTSDRQEGWGAVANEAMNSGCALIADHMIGAVPFLIRDGGDGLIYRDGRRKELFSLAERLVCDKALCRRLGRAAYEKITQSWNAENAAECLIGLCAELGLLRTEGTSESGKTGGPMQEAEKPAGDAAACGKRYVPAGARDTAGGPPVPAALTKPIAERKMYRLLKRRKNE